MTQYSGKVIRKTPVTPTQTSASGVWKLNEQAAAIRNNSWPVPGVPDPISRSVRLRSSASAYFNRTLGTATDSTKWTWSGWAKRGTLTSSQATLFAAYTNASNFCFFMFNSTDDTIRLYVYSGGAIVGDIKTTAVYRDPSAWYHVVLSKTGTTFSLYVNGVSTSWSGTAPPSSVFINTATPHYIGQYGASGAYFDGYLTEINFVDGQALTPSSFGTTDTATGAWIPMAYTGTYGANGFYLNFKDNTSTTTIGYDYSGNANNWTANNISLTAGATYDSMLDVPTPWVGYSTTTDTSAVTRGNYAVLNPLWRLGGSGYITPTNGNLRASCGSTNNIIASTMPLPSTGKWYMEFTLTTGQYPEYGLCNTVANGGGGSSNVYGAYWNGVNNYWFANGSVSTSDANQANTTGDIGLIAVDVDNNKLWIGRTRSGTTVWMGGGNPSSGTSPSFSASGGGGVYATTFNAQTFNNPFVSSGAGADVWDVNFGQSPFTNTPPTGFKTLVTTNLPTPTITNGANYMAASTYTGTGATQSIVNSGNNTAALTFKPDFVWIKQRSGTAQNHYLVDSVRGNTLELASNSTAAEVSASNALTSFNSNGFSLGNNSDGYNVNASTQTYIGWQWQAGQGTTSSNTSGSITSTVSVNTTAGFSVVTYTGTGANATVGHGLGVAPSMIIVKDRDTTDVWMVQHTALGPTKYIILNRTDAEGTISTAWNNTAPTSTVFSIGTLADVNRNTFKYIAYCWAAIAGYSAFGSYTGNGSTDGPFVYLGLRPRWLMVKRTDTAGYDWVILDTSRDPYNAVGNDLYANSSSAEVAGVFRYDFVSNGIKCRTTGLNFNANGGTYIYAAFAEVPFKFANSR